jgi:hypothetical protein
MSDHRTHAKALKLIDRFVKAQSWEEAEPLLRESESLRMNLLRYWKPCLSLPQTQNSDQLTIDYGHSGKVGFYMIEGRCMDNSPFLFFFVHSSGKLKLDWEASMSLGEKTIKELIRHPLAEPTVMRVVVERSPYYLPDLKEQDFESFRLTIPGDENVIWGYAQRGSPQVSALEKVLQQGGILVEGSHSGRATVRLTATEDKKASKRFFISEVIHPNWVMP